MKEVQAIPISVVIPVYNVEKYLQTCLDSILRQSFRELEIILVDDGSPDDCPQICDEYAIHDERIQVIHQKNQGISMARNAGIKAASGKYILFVDSDDVLEDTACENLWKRAESTQADVVEGSTYWIDETGGIAQKEKVRIVQPHIIEETVLDGETYLFRQLKCEAYISTVWAYMYKREFLLQNRLYFMEGVFREDEEWMLRLFCCAQRIAQCDMPFYQYHLWKNSVMRGSVRMAKDFTRKVCPKMMTLVWDIKNQLLRELMVKHIIRTYLASISFFPEYYAKHKEEIDFSFLYKHTNGKIWVWIIFLRLNVKLFCRLWNARGNMKD